MAAVLSLSLPWLPDSPLWIENLGIQRGGANILMYDDHITMDVRVLDPGEYRTAEALTAAALEQRGPGRVVLVAGALPVRWRAALRANGLSFFDSSGVIEIDWPKVLVSTARFAHDVQRQRSPISLQKGHALILQELLVVTGGAGRPTISDLANNTGTSLSTASRAISQLADHGLVAKDRDDNHVRVTVVQRRELAKRLATQTKWPGREALAGFRWRPNTWDLASQLSEAAAKKKIALAVTGRVAAAFLGLMTTSSPERIHCWVSGDQEQLVSAAVQLELERAPMNESNVILSTDPWGVGVHRRQAIGFEQWRASIANPIRIWCDLHAEPRGADIADQLWSVMERG